jgi:hypothetical protein
MWIVSMPDNLRPERTHAARLVFGSHLGSEYRLRFESRTDLAVQFGEGSGPVLTLPDVLFANGPDGWPASVNRPAAVPPRFTASLPGTDTGVPVLFGRQSESGQWWEQRVAGAYLGVDVLGTAFWMLTRLEEQLDMTRDPHERFSGRNAHAVRAGYIDRPVVDETVLLLVAALRRIRPDWIPKHAQSATLLTHDVDRPFKHLFQTPARFFRTLAVDLIKRRDWPSIVAAPTRWLRVRRGLDEADPFFTFDWVMDQSERAGVRSAFYFICGHSGGRLDGDYEVRHPRVRALLRRIHSRGHEIGLHGSYNSFRSADTLRRELATLQSVCEQEKIVQDRWGGRQHVLRFDSAVTPSVWNAAGLSYDSTLGFADVSGFRCGTCHAFPLYDHEARRALEVIERPLIVMDVTLMNREYEGRTPAEATERIEALRAACRRVGGEFVLLWHNCQLTSPAWRSVYSRIQERPVAHV